MVKFKISGRKAKLGALLGVLDEAHYEAGLTWNVKYTPEEDMIRVAKEYIKQNRCHLSVRVLRRKKKKIKRKRRR